MSTSVAVDLTIFFPAYNDALSISGLIAKAAKTAHELRVNFEVLVVNDGSSDNTYAVLEELCTQYTFLRVVHHPSNRGYGGALKSGFLNARGALVFYTDGDGQYDVAELKRLFTLLSEEVDVVNGYKIGRSDSWYRVLLGLCYRTLARICFWLPIRDVDCDFRLMRRSALEKITLRSTSGVICTEMIYKLARSGARFRECGVKHLPREFGQSQFFTFRRVGKTLLDFFKLWFCLVVQRRE